MSPTMAWRTAGRLVEAAPEVVEAKFFFQLLMGLLAESSRLDGGGQGTQVRPCG